MKNLSFLGVLVFLFIAQAAYANGGAPAYKEGECWRFKVEEWDFITNSNVALGNGEYEVCLNGNELAVSKIVADVKTPWAEESGQELKCMVPAEPCKFGYITFPLSELPKWKPEYQYRIPGLANSSQWRAQHELKETTTVEIKSAKLQGQKIARSDYASIQRGNYSSQTRWDREYTWCAEQKVICEYLMDSSVLLGRGGKRRITLIEFKPAPAPLPIAQR